MNVLDNQLKAAELYRALWLEKAEIIAGMNYDAATTWCENCPTVTGIGRCCKDEQDYLAQENAAIAELDTLMELLKKYAGEDLTARVLSPESSDKRS